MPVGRKVRGSNWLRPALLARPKMDWVWPRAISMRVTLSHEMLTGPMEPQLSASSDAIAALLALEGTGASSIAVDLQEHHQPPSMSLADNTDSSSHSINLVDARRPDCALISGNKVLELLTGYTQDECRGRNCRFLQGAETSRLPQAICGEHVSAELRSYLTF